jgi:predicted aspartyl protease
MVRVQVSNPANGDRTMEQEMVVDTGAYMSVLPRPVLTKLGIRVVDRRTFGLAEVISMKLAPS